MRKQGIVIVIVSMLFAGCSSVQTSARFRGQMISVGQSTDSIENLLGQPDEATSARFDPFWSNMKVLKIDSWIRPGNYTIEWVYWDDPQSLLLWLEGNSVQGIWLADTNRIR